ncbi:MAG: hypothetical protein IKB59_03340 [Alphaproteobacteria bacterium]|nr:hypothetical protein [Alphaproteobacteria bacterium]
MKKLTAGILASLIGLVSANSADAAVASKAYVDGAIETLDAAKVGTDAVTSFVKTVSETDGKISATAGDLGDVVIGGDNVTVTKNATGQLVIDGHAADGNTQYKFEDGEGVDFTGTYDEASDTYTYTADAKIKAADGSTNVTIGKETVGDQDYVTISVAEGMTYTGVDDVNVSEDGKINTKYYGADNVDGKSSTEEGWYVLMRKADPTQPNGYKYQWELVDRSYDANDLDVAHDEGTQPAQG